MCGAVVAPTDPPDWVFGVYLVRDEVGKFVRIEIEPADADTALLLGDYLYAHGLVRVAQAGPVEAVSDLAALISLCAQLRADGLPGDGEAWAATAATLGRGEDARLTWRPGPEAERALEKHGTLVG